MSNRISTVFVLGWVLLVMTACTGLPNEATESQTGVDESSLRNDSSQLADFRNLSKNSAGYVDIVATQLVEVLGDDALTIVNVHIPDEGGLPALSCAFT